MTLTNTANSYQGGTTISNGVLDFVAGALPFSTTSPNIFFNGGTLQWAVGNTQDVSAGIAPLTGQSAMIDTNGDTVQFASSLSGSGGLTKIGAGTLVLAAANSYVGTTTISGGTLSAANAAAIPSGGAITFGGGVLQYTAASSGNDYSSLNRIVNSGGPIAIDTNGQNVTFNGGLPASNTGGLDKIGAGTLTLNGSNAYAGATTINGGTLSLGSALPAGSTVTFRGGTLQYTASTSSVDYSSVIQNSTGPVAIDTNGQSVTFNSPLVNSNSGGLTKIGAGTLVLASAAANTYGGPTVIQGGTLQLKPSLPPVATPSFTSDATSGIGASPLPYTEALAFNQGANLTINGVTFANANNASGTGNLGSSWAFSQAIANGYPNTAAFNAPTGFLPASGQGTYSLLSSFLLRRLHKQRHRHANAYRTGARAKLRRPDVLSRLCQHRSGQSHCRLHIHKRHRHADRRGQRRCECHGQLHRLPVHGQFGGDGEHFRDQRRQHDRGRFVALVRLQQPAFIRHLQFAADDDEPLDRGQLDSGPQRRQPAGRLAVGQHARPRRQRD